MDNFRKNLQQYGRDTFSSLYVRNYRLYYIGQIISTSGTFMQSVAQAWLVLQLTNSGTALGITSALQYVPILILGPYGGVIADRISKRKILYFTQALSGILALILGVLTATGVVQVWMVYILAFCLGVVTVFDNPARQTLYIELVGTENLRNAVTLYSMLVNLARVIGPALAAALIAGFGLAPSFIINGISYGAVVIMLAMLRSEELMVTPPLPRAKGQFREALRYAAASPVLAGSLVMMGIVGMLTFEFQVSLPLIAQYTFHGDASSYAFLTGSMGFGSVIGGIAFAGSKAAEPGKLAGAALLFGVAVVAAAMMPSIVLSALALVVVGIFSINFSSLGNSILQLESSPQMRGRVMSFWTIAFLGTTTMGGPIVGWFGETAGARWGLAIGGIAALLAAGLGAAIMRRVTASTPAQGGGTTPA